MNDELMHATGDDPSWSESYYFNFVDPVQKIGMFTRVGFRPGNGWADALHVIYLAGRRVIFTYGRRDITSDLSQYDDDLNVGDLTIRCDNPHQKWQIIYNGPGQDIPDAEILLERRKLRKPDWFTPTEMNMALTFDCTTQPHYAASGERGHFEQSGQVTGNIQVGAESYDINGFGVRDKSWGPRDWGASLATTEKPSEQHSGPAPFVNWFSMNFGDYAALGGACQRSSDGFMRGQGWIQRDGKSLELSNVTIETQYKPDSIIHESIVLQATTEDGESIHITGRISSVCPTKIPMQQGATFINEGLAEFEWDGRQGFGIAEHWHAVSLA